MQCDVAIVGGGVGGSSLAANLGLRVVVLERETDYVDRVRGEWITPWGTAECAQLGVLDVLLGAGANQVARMISYDELTRPEDAELASLVFSSMVPHLPAPLCVGHVLMQNALVEFAKTRGAKVWRGVSAIELSAGQAPALSFNHEGQQHTLRPRLIVGSDGRTSTVRRQLGLALTEDPIDHLMSGQLVIEAYDWPSDAIAVGKIGDVSYFVFPQGHGKVRAYVDYSIAERGRYTGEAGARRLIEALAHDCLPGDAMFRTARPAGPCQAFPSQDASLDVPVVEGAVLIGRAAGYSDPIWGQGLSFTFRDSRMVRDLLLGSSNWSTSTFAPYVEERRERTRRLQWETRFATALFGRFDADALAARARAKERMTRQPEMAGYILAGIAGPEVLPPAVFTQSYFDALFGP